MPIGQAGYLSSKRQTGIRTEVGVGIDIQDVKNAVSQADILRA